jgi:hypothetical protein
MRLVWSRNVVNLLSSNWYALDFAMVSIPVQPFTNHMHFIHQVWH